MDYRHTIQASLDYIEQNLKTEITAAELADRAGFSLFHYYHIFQDAVGMPVMQYILRRRLLHAIYAIDCGSTQIEAALTYGFNTYSGFYKAFYREFSCTPSDYLKKQRVRQPYPINLLKEFSMNVTHKKASELLKHWNVDDQPISDIYYDSSGNRNENAYYAGSNFVLKFTANLEKINRHIALSRALEAAGLQTAPAVKTRSGKDYVHDGELYFYLTKRLSGRQILPGDLYGNPGYARFVGEIIGQLHLALQKVDYPVNEADLCDTVQTWAMPKAKDILHLGEDFCSAFLDKLKASYSQLPRQIIHRDPNPGNIIDSSGEWGFLDFELSEQNVRIYDPCYAATAVLSEMYSKESPENHSQWIPLYKEIILGYDSVITLTETEWEAIPYVLLANQLVCVAWFAEQNNCAEIFQTNKQMTFWLIEHFDLLKFN